MTDEKKDDLSSLISLPPDSTGSDPSGDASSAHDPGSIEFESLEELSNQEFPAPSIPLDAPTFESSVPQEGDAISGLDLSNLNDSIPSAPNLASENQTPAETGANGELAQGAGISLSQENEPDATASPALALDQAPEPTPPLDSIKTYSEKLATTPAHVAAAFPFTLKIEGKLAPEDAEKLMGILTREQMGFREVDLEPQIQEGRILIPRISEYAGVLLVSALRGIRAKISFGPSDEIFSTPETRDDPPVAESAPTWSSHDEIAEVSASQDVPVTRTDTLPQFATTEVIDTIVSSGLLSTRAVEAASSSEYEKLLEALIRELKFKAKRRGANAVLSLQITLTPLTLPTDYRVTVTGTAVLGHPTAS